MSSTSNDPTNNNVDPWSSSGSTKPHRARRGHPPKTTKHVPDAWDDDDDAGEEEAVDSAAVWNDANAKQPMPEVILTTSSTSSSAAPPPEALHQPMKILKRPSASASTSSSSVASINSTGPGSGTGQGGSTLKDREAAYQAARARIFGGEGKLKDADGNTTKETVNLQEAKERLKYITLESTNSKLENSSLSTIGQTTPVTTSSVIRNPLGPPSVAISGITNGISGPASEGALVNQKGFTKRRAGGTGVNGRSNVTNSVGGSGSVSSNAKPC